jgi:NADPH:quinone reductase-like Zn-dependent oxidoreductase
MSSGRGLSRPFKRFCMVGIAPTLNNDPGHGALPDLHRLEKLGNLLLKPTQADLLVLKNLIEAGKVRPVIERRYLLNEVSEAIRYLETGHAGGKLVIAI